MECNKRSERGFTLMTTGLSIFIIVSTMGLAFDMGRVYISRNEAQAFTDSAALGAAARLNGTQAGVTAAQAEVTNNPNRWNMASSAFSGVTTEFSTDQTSWVSTPAASAIPNTRYVRVTAPSNSVTISFMRVLGLASSMTVASRTIAGTQMPTTESQGVFPFAPLAKNSNGPNYGYSKGDELTLLWPSSVGSNGNVKLNNLCQVDQNQAALAAVQNGTTADRGYIQDTSASAIASAIEDDHMDYTVSVGLEVSRSGGVKSNDVTGSIANRVAQDSDSNTSNYDTYIANHNGTPLRRVVIVPIINNAAQAVVLGFVKVFLPPSQPRNPNDSKCAMYIGPADSATGTDGTGSNQTRLMQ
ncbi:MAG TPA: pilus assembly protein TadG-related protein [Bryobacteraceae bacterium]|nr:pilus assembly protein TadG-related protein [Bryobacteraceae bacterium]